MSGYTEDPDKTSTEWLRAAAACVPGGFRDWIAAQYNSGVSNLSQEQLARRQVAINVRNSVLYVIDTLANLNSTQIDYNELYGNMDRILFAMRKLHYNELHACFANIVAALAKNLEENKVSQMQVLQYDDDDMAILQDQLDARQAAAQSEDSATVFSSGEDSGADVVPSVRFQVHTTVRYVENLDNTTPLPDQKMYSGQIITEARLAELELALEPMKELAAARQWGAALKSSLKSPQSLDLAAQAAADIAEIEGLQSMLAEMRAHLQASGGGTVQLSSAEAAQLQAAFHRAMTQHPPDASGPKVRPDS